MITNVRLIGFDNILLKTANDEVMIILKAVKILSEKEVKHNGKQNN